MKEPTEDEYGAAVASIGSILERAKAAMPEVPEVGSLASQMNVIAMSVSNERWGWSIDKDAETFTGSYITRDMAILDAQSHGHTVFYVQYGRCPDGASYMPEGDTILDMIAAAASDAAGEVAEEFPSVSQEVEDELNAVLKEWADKHLGTCTFWISEGPSEKIDLTSVSAS